MPGIEVVQVVVRARSGLVRERFLPFSRTRIPSIPEDRTTIQRIVNGNAHNTYTLCFNKPICDCSRTFHESRSTDGAPRVNPWSLFVPGFAVVSATFPGRHHAVALVKRIHPRVNPWFSAWADKSTDICDGIQKIRSRYDSERISSVFEEVALLVNDIGYVETE